MQHSRQPEENQYKAQYVTQHKLENKQHKIIHYKIQTFKTSEMTTQKQQTQT